ncbi:ubiquinone/menaquinone biosynthesis C-methyltransferase UbiE [Rickettsiales bacterium]|nr:ubiquinone/menaquinone biosynthesis C-methyltransferase UbiE [Rickettsiales bacterium]
MPKSKFDGFDKFNKHKKYSLVRGIFDSVYSHYDLMNDLMSLGLHRLWKQRMISVLNPKKNANIIDMAGGTADIAALLVNSSSSKVTVCDASYSMLSQGRYKLIDRNILDNLNWVCCAAESLPFDDDYFDYYTVSFGLRNFSSPSLALKEAWRVLKPGGKFVCLEFSHISVFKRLYSAYLNNVIPKIGKLVTGNYSAYEYLAESIEQFYTQEELVHLIKKAGFSSVSFSNMACGIVAFHVAFKDL